MKKYLNSEVFELNLPLSMMVECQQIKTISKETKSMSNETLNSLTLGENVLLLNKMHLYLMTKQIQSKLILNSQCINKYFMNLKMTLKLKFA